MDKEINSKITVTIQLNDAEMEALKKSIEVVNGIADTITEYKGEYLDPDHTLNCGWDSISRNSLVEVAAQLGYILEVVDGTEDCEIF